jgi:hypothetical protein
MCMGLNDGGINRGDTGDLEARHKDGVDRKGSGVRAGDEGPGGSPTADPSSFDGGVISGASSKSGTPTYPAVEHGDAEGYIDEEDDEGDSAEKA